MELKEYPFALRKNKEGKYYIALNSHFTFYFYDTLGLPTEIIEKLAKEYYPKNKEDYIKMFGKLYLEKVFE